MLQDVLQGFKELVFPDNCFLCRSYLNSSHQKQLCPECSSRLRLNTPPFCLLCSRHLEVFSAEGLCTTCQKSQYAFDAAWSACLYETPLDKLIYAYKYYGKTHLKRLFSRLMIDFIDTYRVPLHHYDLIMPIPLHPTRLRERGYNQAGLLSERLSQHYQIPHESRLLKRVKYSESQTVAGVKQRWTNVQDAFKMNTFLGDKNILIVDDLLTTAATAHHAALELKSAGAASVGVLTLAVTHENPS